MKLKNIIIKAIPIITVLWVLLMFLSLKFGILDAFFFDSTNAHVQGIDYFALPKSFLNLINGISLYDTWGGAPYGPYATWYLAHPAFTVFVASWFSVFLPWTSYWLFVVFSLILLIYAGRLIANNTDSAIKKRLSYLLIICSFPTYWLLYVGNMHAPLVLALVFIFAALYQFSNADDTIAIKKANGSLYAGLLISFFTKPIVLLMLPVLLLCKQTRKTTFISLLIYGVVSILFIVVPVLNPQGVGLSKLSHVMFDFDYIKSSMNIYKNNFVLNEYMKDNSIHWLNLIAQSDYRFMHVDVFSLPVFTDTLLGRHLNAGIYKIPIYITLILSCLVPFIKDQKVKFQTMLLLVMAISVTFFLSYNTVWEYQYSSILPIIAFLPILWDSNPFYKKNIPGVFLTGLFFYIPSFYFLVKGKNVTPAILTIIHLDRVVPALVLFILLLIPVISIVVKQVIKPATKH